MKRVFIMLAIVLGKRRVIVRSKKQSKRGKTVAKFFAAKIG